MNTTDKSYTVDVKMSFNLWFHCLQIFTDLTFRVLNALGHVGEAMVNSTDMYNSSMSNYAIGAVRQTLTAFKGGYVAYLSHNDSKSNGELYIARKDSPRPRSERHEEVSITIPPMAIQKSTANAPNTAITFVYFVFHHSKLFPGDESRTVNSRIISAEIRRTVVNSLEDPILLKFKKKTQPKNNQSYCSWWDISKAGMFLNKTITSFRKC